jgi:hypothetical protein
MPAAGGTRHVREMPAVDLLRFDVETFPRSLAHPLGPQRPVPCRQHEGGGHPRRIGRRCLGIDRRRIEQPQGGQAPAQGRHIAVVEAEVRTEHRIVDGFSAELAPVVVGDLNSGLRDLVRVTGSTSEVRDHGSQPHQMAGANDIRYDREQQARTGVSDHDRLMDGCAELSSGDPRVLLREQVSLVDRDVDRVRPMAPTFEAVDQSRQPDGACPVPCSST